MQDYHHVTTALSRIQVAPCKMSDNPSMSSQFKIIDKTETFLIPWLDLLNIFNCLLMYIQINSLQKYMQITSKTQVKPRSAPLAQDEDLGEEGGGYAVPRCFFYLIVHNQFNS